MGLRREAKGDGTLTKKRRPGLPGRAQTELECDCPLPLSWTHAIIPNLTSSPTMIWKAEPCLGNQAF